MVNLRLNSNCKKETTSQLWIIITLLTLFAQNPYGYPGAVISDKHPNRTIQLNYSGFEIKLGRHNVTKPRQITPTRSPSFNKAVNVSLIDALNEIFLQNSNSVQEHKRRRQRRNTLNNTPPKINGNIDTLNASYCSLFTYDLPKQLFIDKEDGALSNLTLALLDRSGSKVDQASWVQIQSSLQILFGYLKVSDAELADTDNLIHYKLAATDSGGLTENVSLSIRIPASIPNIFYKVKLTVNSFSDQLKPDVEEEVFLATKIVKYFQDTFFDSVNILSFERNVSASKITFGWSNCTLQADTCPEENIKMLIGKVMTDDGKPNSKFTTNLKPQYIIYDIEATRVGKCAIAITPTAAFSSIHVVTSTLVYSNAPQARKTIPQLTVTTAEYFTYEIPSNLFHDSIDGNTRDLSLQLRTSTSNVLSRSSWMQFDAKTQTMYGILTSDQFPATSFTRKFQYLLTATNSRGFSTQISITLQGNRQTASFGAEFSISGRDNSEYTTNNVKVLQEILLKLRQYLPQTESSSIEGHLVNPSLTIALAPSVVADRIDIVRLGACALISSRVMPSPTIGNLYPELKNRIPILNIQAGFYFYYQIPADTFYDTTDGDTSRLTLNLLHIDGKPLNQSSWIQLDSTNQHIYGLITASQQAIRPYQSFIFTLSAKNSLGYTTKQNIEVRSEYSANNIGVQVVLKGREYNTMQLNNVQLQSYIINQLKKYFRVTSNNTISVLLFIRQSTAGPLFEITWTDARLNSANCNLNLLRSLKSMILSTDGNIHTNLTIAMTSNTVLYEATVNYYGSCLQKASSVIVSPTPTINSPQYSNNIPIINATAGTFFKYQILRDAFIDSIDGDTRQLQLSLVNIDGTALGTASLVYFNITDQTISGLIQNFLVKGTIEKVFTYTLIATNSKEYKTSVPITVRAFEYNKVIGITVKTSMNVRYSTSTTDLRIMQYFINKISNYIQNSTINSFIIISYVRKTSPNHELRVTWTHDVIDGSSCDLTALEEFKSDLQYVNDQPNTAFVKAMSSEFGVLSVVTTKHGTCQTFVTLTTEISMVIQSSYKISKVSQVTQTKQFSSTVSIPVDNPPKVTSRMLPLFAYFCKLFSYTIPLDLFHDEEQGNTRKLKLRLEHTDGRIVDKSSWLQLSQSSQAIYGILKVDDYRQGGYKYHLTAIDNSGQTATTDFTITTPILPPQINHVIQIRFDRIFDKTIPDVNEQIIFLTKTLNYYNDGNENKVNIISYNTSTLNNQAIVKWSNCSLPYTPCTNTQLNVIINKMLTTDGRIVQSFRNAMAPYVIHSLSVERLGPCGHTASRTTAFVQSTITAGPTIVHQPCSHCSMSTDLTTAHASSPYYTSRGLRITPTPNVSRPNTPPRFMQIIPIVNASLCSSFSLQLQPDICYDNEDGFNGTSLSVTYENGTSLSKKSMLQYEKTSRIIYGVVKGTDLNFDQQIKEKYIVTCTDTSGLNTSQSLVFKRIRKMSNPTHSVTFQTYISSFDKPNVDILILWTKKMQNYYQMLTTSEMHFLYFTKVSDIQVIFAMQLCNRDMCNETETAELRNKTFSTIPLLNAAFVASMAPEFSIVSAVFSQPLINLSCSNTPFSSSSIKTSSSSSLSIHSSIIISETYNTMQPSMQHSSFSFSLLSSLLPTKQEYSTIQTGLLVSNIGTSSYKEYNLETSTKVAQITSSKNIAISSSIIPSLPNTPPLALKVLFIKLAYCNVFRYKIPSNIFIDKQDGDTLKLQLSLLDMHRREPDCNFSLRLNDTSKEINGIVLTADWKTERFMLLQARDSKGLTAVTNVTFSPITQQSNATVTVTFLFQSKLNCKRQILIVLHNKLSSYFPMENITFISIIPGHTMNIYNVTWTLCSAYDKPCNSSQIIEISKKLLKKAMPNDKLIEVLSPDMLLLNVSINNSTKCLPREEQYFSRASTTLLQKSSIISISQISPTISTIAPIEPTTSTIVPIKPSTPLPNTPPLTLKTLVIKLAYCNVFRYKIPSNIFIDKQDGDTLKLQLSLLDMHRREPDCNFSLTLNDTSKEIHGIVLTADWKTERFMLLQARDSKGLTAVTNVTFLPITQQSNATVTVTFWFQSKLNCKRQILIVLHNKLSSYFPMENTTFISIIPGHTMNTYNVTWTLCSAYDKPCSRTQISEISKKLLKKTMPNDKLIEVLLPDMLLLNVSINNSTKCLPREEQYFSRASTTLLQKSSIISISQISPTISTIAPIEPTTSAIVPIKPSTPLPNTPPLTLKTLVIKLAYCNVFRYKIPSNIFIDKQDCDTLKLQLSLLDMHRREPDCNFSLRLNDTSKEINGIVLTADWKTERFMLLQARDSKGLTAVTNVTFLQITQQSNATVTVTFSFQSKLNCKRQILIVLHNKLSSYFPMENITFISIIPDHTMNIYNVTWTLCSAYDRPCNRAQINEISNTLLTKTMPNDKLIEVLLPDMLLLNVSINNSTKCLPSEEQYFSRTSAALMQKSSITSILQINPTISTVAEIMSGINTTVFQEHIQYTTVLQEHTSTTFLHHQPTVSLTTTVVVTPSPVNICLKNTKPQLINSIKTFTVQISQPFAFNIPNDIAYDIEDGSLQNMRAELTGMQGRAVEYTWIYFDSKNKTIYISYLEADRNISNEEYQFQIIITDSCGASVYDIFKVRVFGQVPCCYFIQTSLNVSYSELSTNNMLQYQIYKRVENFLNETQNDIRIHLIQNMTMNQTSNSIMMFTNASLTNTSCHEEAIRKFSVRFLFENGTARQSFLATLAPFGITNAKGVYNQHCNASLAIIPPVIPIVPTPIGVRTFEDWLWYILPFIILAFLIAMCCLLYYWCLSCCELCCIGKKKKGFDPFSDLAAKAFKDDASSLTKQSAAVVPVAVAINPLKSTESSTDPPFEDLYAQIGPNDDMVPSLHKHKQPKSFIAPWMSQAKSSDDGRPLTAAAPRMNDDEPDLPLTAGVAAMPRDESPQPIKHDPLTSNAAPMFQRQPRLSTTSTFSMLSSDSAQPEEEPMTMTTAAMPESAIPAPMPVDEDPILAIQRPGTQAPPPPRLLTRKRSNDPALCLPSTPSVEPYDPPPPYSPLEKRSATSQITNQVQSMNDDLINRLHPTNQNEVSRQLANRHVASSSFDPRASRSSEGILRPVSLSTNLTEDPRAGHVIVRSRSPREGKINSRRRLVLVDETVPRVRLRKSTYEKPYKQPKILRLVERKPQFIRRRKSTSSQRPVYVYTDKQIRQSEPIHRHHNPSSTRRRHGSHKPQSRHVSENDYETESDTEVVTSSERISHGDDDDYNYDYDNGKSADHVTQKPVPIEVNGVFKAPENVLRKWFQESAFNSLVNGLSPKSSQRRSSKRKPSGRKQTKKRVYVDLGNEIPLEIRNSKRKIHARQDAAIRHIGVNIRDMQIKDGKAFMLYESDDPVIKSKSPTWELKRGYPYSKDPYEYVETALKTNPRAITISNNDADRHSNYSKLNHDFHDYQTTKGRFVSNKTNRRTAEILTKHSRRKELKKKRELALSDLEV
eukprot:gene14401-15900_t